MPTKYDPNKRQLQITNKYLCESLNAYALHIRAMANACPSARERLDHNLTGAVELLRFMGFEPILREDGLAARIHKLKKKDALRIRH